VLISYRYGRRARPAIQETQQRIGELTADAEENISGVRVVKSFAREQRQLERFSHSVSRVFDQSMVATRLEARYNPMIGFLPQLGLAAVLLVGGVSVINAHLKLGEFTAFYLYLNMLVGPMRSLGVILNLAQRATASGDRIFQLLDREPRLTELSGAPELPAGSGHVVLRGVTLRIPVGQVVALVGISGGGKSTLADLIPRFYDATEGRITIDGVDIRGITLASLRSHIAVVTQFTFLFNDSVRNNIAYGEPSRPMEEVVAAARAANAHDFISELPRGYETHIGDLGVRLSGGQRQRLAIARALLKNAPILILDEATSALDTESEGLVQEALERLMANRTTLVVAHRLSTVRRADRIVVLVHGEIAESGTHEELLARGAEYRKLYELQFRDLDAPLGAPATLAPRPRPVRQVAP